jgi:catechol 2,3-dioxygenase-like lactoylglutathione lyase family enzyme
LVVRDLPSRSCTLLAHPASRSFSRSTPATLARWYVDNVERVVDELTAQGIAFERYDEGPIAIDENGIATFEGGAEVALFRDPDGNTFSIARAPRK